MKDFIWSELFITGFTNIDKQHLYLVNLINDFSDKLLKNKISEKNANDLLLELHTYVISHFKEEEKLMKQYKVYPVFIKKHIKIHREFLSRIISIKRELALYYATSLKLLIDFLIYWLNYHILGMDQNMARQIVLIEEGYTPEEAYLMENCKSEQATDTLLNALNHLFQEVFKRNVNLYRLNQTLEEKVNNRTLELQNANEYLKKLSDTDTLTNLPNRRYAKAQLNKLWEEADKKNKELSCLMIDIDKFKEVNDKFGHDAGDKVLIKVSKQLKRTLRNDDLICRLGGDEFLVICENTNLAGAECIALLLCNEIAKYKVYLGKSTWVGTISIGVASKEKHMKSQEELIKLADQGVYKAKQAGKNRSRTVHK